jgi:hypothetical protein
MKCTVRGFAAGVALALLSLKAPSASAAGDAPAVNPAALKSAPAASSMEIRPGQRLIGPGIVSVGWFGAKRQVVVPRGEWVVLDTLDHELQGLVTLQMSTLVLGQFERDVATSVVVITFNSRSVPVMQGVSAAAGLQGFGPVPRWPAQEQCEARTRDEEYRDMSAERRLRICAVVRPVPNAVRWALDLDPLVAGHVAAALKSVGATAPVMSMRTDVHMIEPSLAYLGYVRFDTATPSGKAAERARSFVPVAKTAYWRDFDEDDLEDGRRADVRDGALRSLPD